MPVEVIKVIYECKYMWYIKAEGWSGIEDGGGWRGLGVRWIWGDTINLYTLLDLVPTRSGQVRLSEDMLGNVRTNYVTHLGGGGGSSKPYA